MTHESLPLSCILHVLANQLDIRNAVKCKKYNKSAILNVFSAVIEIVRKLLISHMQNNFEQDQWKTFHDIAP